MREFLIWTRRNVYRLFLLGLVPVVFHEVLGLKWLTIPWPVVALLGTATAFTVGFKNAQTYNRASDGQRIWSDLLSMSRYWGVISLDFLNNTQKSKDLIYTHIAWLIALRYYLRQDRICESVEKKHNQEYKRFFQISERQSSLESELKKYLSNKDLKVVMSAKNRAGKILALQSRTVKELFENNQIGVVHYGELERSIKDFFLQLGKAEQLKEFPYPRQYAIIIIFCLDFLHAASSWDHQGI